QRRLRARRAPRAARGARARRARPPPPAPRAPASGRSPAGGPAASGLLRLSPEGLAHSDALGPELFSPAVRAAMAAYEAK
ncbi:coproporphyrinogen III oxidase family protein, partial [[Kitasatospora] papulosa]